MTYSQLVKALGQIPDTEPESEAFILLNHLFNAERADFILYSEKDYSSDKLNAALKRRAVGTPVQYITGKAFFYGYEFCVSPDCLIPRADTEILCEQVIKLLPENAHFLELCTGSGCIPVTVIKERPDTSGIAIELFDNTAELAIKNRELNGICEKQLKIRCADALNLSLTDNTAAFDAIISNPPYIPTEEIGNLSRQVQNEPKAALDGGDDGMIFYNKFLKSYSFMLKPGGFFAFETGYDQAHLIQRLCNELSFTCEIVKDYSKNDRVAIIRP